MFISFSDLKGSAFVAYFRRFPGKLVSTSLTPRSPDSRSKMQMIISRFATNLSIALSIPLSFCNLFTPFHFQFVHKNNINSFKMPHIINCITERKQKPLQCYQKVVNLQ
jgi:hypothetical protein